MKNLMIQGTSSACGKSLVTAALCRILHQDGYRVAPFKAQNMSNNSFVTSEGLEMGRAQAVQAFASGLDPDIRMNPVLLKPSENGSQVIIRGKPSSVIEAGRLMEIREKLRCTISQCYESISSEYQIIVLEGAGSPAEINLKQDDIVNMYMAKMADAPVVIVGDIDRGGVFASLAGTMLLLDPDEREMVKGFIINKFRGRSDLLKPGLDQLEKITGIPVLGVVPWIDHAIDDEDSVTELFTRKDGSCKKVDIVVIRLPHIPNFTDIIPLEAIPDINVRWCDSEDNFGSPDLLIIPGTKSTISDLKKLKKSGIAGKIIEYAGNGGFILGICGGFQILGKAIKDPFHKESDEEYEKGLGLLDMTTVFETEKTTLRSSFSISGSSAKFFTDTGECKADGYEIHMGRSEYGSSCVPFTVSENGKITGIADQSGLIAGTYHHGLFDSSVVVKGVVNSLRKHKNLPPLQEEIVDRRMALEHDFDILADIFRKHLDMDRIMEIIRKDGSSL